MSTGRYQIEAWSLEELFSSTEDPAVKTAFEELESLVMSFEAFRTVLKDDLAGEKFLEILEAYEAIVRALNRLGGYASLSFSGDTQDQELQAFMAKTQQLGAEVDNRTLFFKLWWKALDDSVASGLLDASGDYRYFLESLRRTRPYTLSEPEEKIINIKDVNGPSALLNLYTTITNRYSFHLEVEGELKELTREELDSYRRSTDPDLRAACYQEQFRVFGDDTPILGQIYQYRLRDWKSELVDLRGYSSPIAPRNLGNDIPDEVVEILLSTSIKNRGLFHRFFELKAKLIGMERLRRYDIYAPVVKSDKTYEYREAVDMVLESFSRFDPRFEELARRVFDQKHIDSEVRKGKRSGAFCATLNPDLTPWILQTYNGKPRDVSTMAHELGHAIHSMLADHHTALTQHASLPLAETASTFAEMVFVDDLLESESDPAVQRDVLFTQMDDAYATIMRQAYFALFEKEAHDMVSQGATVDELSAAYLENLKEQFGDSLELSEDFQHEWLTIPHIYGVPFYVYAYSFGQLLVLSLYQQFKEEGDAFKPRYLEILAAGGSRSPEQVLTDAGVDIRSETFWQGGFDVVEESLNRLEALEIPY